MNSYSYLAAGSAALNQYREHRLDRLMERTIKELFQKGGGTPNPLRTCIGSCLKHGNEEKDCFFCTLLQSISKKGFGSRRQN